MLRRSLLAAVCGVLLTPALASAWPITYGAPGSFWRTSLPANVALSSETAAAQTELAGEAQRAAPYVNTTKYSSTIYRATASTRRVGVYIGQSDGTQSNTTKQLQEAFKRGTAAAMTGIPDPALYGYQPVAGDTDYEYAAYCASCTSPDGTRHGYTWDLWRLAKCDPATALGAAGITAGYTWCARWGGRDSGVAESPGHPTRDWEGYAYPTSPDPLNASLSTKAAKFEDPGWMATATSLPLAAGEITEADVHSGCICHAVGLAAIYPRPGYRWPAQRGDGWKSGSAIQEGMRLRLPAGYVIPSTLSPLARMIARAARDYGLVLWDKAGALGVRAEPAVRNDPIWAGLAPYQELAHFPWTQLQVLATGSDATPNPVG